MVVNKYEYAIRFRRDGTTHRSGLASRKEAEEWMSPEEWGDLDAHKLFEIVRRLIGPWKPVEPTNSPVS